MSQELLFYPAVKRNEIYEPLMVTTTGEIPVMLARNAKTIHREDFLWNIVSVGELSDVFRDEFGIEDEEQIIDLYVMTEGEIEKASDNGLIKGYAYPSEICDYLNDGWYYPKMIPIEIYAELSEEQRKDYVQFAYVDTSSRGYICSCLHEFLWAQYVPNGELCVLVLHSY